MSFTGKQSLKDYPEKEKTAYLAAVASMATPEDKASAEEEEFLADLCEEAGLTQRDTEEVIMEARDPVNDGFARNLDFLRNSELKYSFVVDVLSYAKADGHFSDEEKKKIHRMADRLGISIEQYNALQEYVEKAEQAQGAETTQEGFLENTGLKQKFEKLNIPVRGLLSGLVGSMLMSGIMGRRRRGGLLTRLMGGGYRRRSGLSSVVGMLSGNRGYRRSGSLLGKLF
ncbi:tellurite resistance TerB family protein [Nafulsella turpanensis]|uniref:tellurite resistance TerB family protein n=1 Tax=Nafulsella turpanensis TaxID=1265690 RepID=UPI00034CF115|nr:TerB family tellurite resistance protein [Nafulsella turpanensis]